jgi:uncharacterized damage-inducible protein DinB
VLQDQILVVSALSILFSASSELLRAFCGAGPLFSILCELFSQKTPGVGVPVRDPPGRTIFSNGHAPKFACLSSLPVQSAYPDSPLPGAKKMPISELLVAEWDQEGANTRKALERVPAEKWDWKPHPKSGTLGWMASHIATLPHFAITTIKTSEFEIEGGERPKVDGHSRLLPVFDEQLKKGHDAIAGVTDEQLRQIWTLKWKGNALFSMPKYNVIRGMCFNHIIHHRAQLTMYLRTLDIPVPALYGPSADEQNF